MDSQVDDTDSLEKRRARIQERRMRLKARMTSNKSPETNGYVVVEQSNPISQSPLISLEKHEESSQENESIVNDIVCSFNEAISSRIHPNFEDILKKVIEEDEICRTKLEEISENWSEICKVKAPEHLHESLTAQKRSTDELVERKDALIQSLNGTLRDLDEHYDKMLKLHLQNVSTIVKEMNRQIEGLNSSHQREITAFEKKLQNERKVLLEKNFKTWKELVSSYVKTRENAIADERTKVEEHLKGREMLSAAGGQALNELNGKMLAQIKALEQQVQKTRITHLVKEDRLKYNYDVLKKRQEENSKTRSVQKRELLPLRDQFAKLKCQLLELVDGSKAEKKRLLAESSLLKDLSVALESKLRIIRRGNNRKFVEMWKMDKEEAMQLFELVVTLERSICTDILAMEFNVPDNSFMHGKDPVLNFVNGTELQTDSSSGNLSCGQSMQSSSKDSVLIDFSHQDVCIEENELESSVIKAMENTGQISQQIGMAFSMVSRDERRKDIEELNQYYQQTFSAIDDSQRIDKLSSESHADNKRRQSCDDWVDFKYNSKRDGVYWKKYLSIVTDSKQLLWDTLMTGLEKYRDLLVQGARLKRKSEELIIENEELEHFLIGCVAD